MASGSDVLPWAAAAAGVVTAVVTGWFRRPEQRLSETGLALGAWKDLVVHLRTEVEECERQRAEDHLWMAQQQQQITDLQEAVDVLTNMIGDSQ